MASSIVHIRCPQCKRSKGVIVGRAILEYRDPSFHCICGYHKPLVWRRAA